MKTACSDMGMFTEEPLFEDSSLPEGWYRKVVQRQTGATAGQWDVYIYNPEGKKFRSRNELRSYLGQIGSELSADEFDFSVKGKGHQTKGKSPTKQVSVPSTPQTASRLGRTRKPQTPVATPPSPLKLAPKRNSLGKVSTPRTQSKKKAPTVKDTRADEDQTRIEDEENEEEADEKEPEVSNVKLKVKVGYTSSGAMIRPATGGRKKRKRFRNLDKKSPPLKKSISPLPTPDTKETVSSVNSNKKEESTPATQRKKEGPVMKKRKKVIEPVPGPSGLQKVKRSPRRILRRHGQSESEDDEDYDYMFSLYPNTSEDTKTEGLKGSEAVQQPASDTAEPALEEAKSAEVIPDQPAPELHPEPEEEKPTTNGEPEKPVRADDTETEQAGINGSLAPEEAHSDGVGPMLSLDEVEPEAENETGGVADGEMQVVVVGDSFKDIHNYAKPPTLT